MPPLRDSLQDALTYLPSALDEPFSGHPLGGLLVRDVPEALRAMVPEQGYKVQGSPGRGRWAETVWVSIFDRLVTETAQQGYYLVYLFRRDGSGVYLSVNQGTTAVHAEVGGRRYLDQLRSRAAAYRGLLLSEGIDDLLAGPLDLGGGGTLTRGYEAANVAARYYKVDVVPDDDELRQDVGRFLALYQRLIAANDHLVDADTPKSANGPTSEGDPVPVVEAKRLRWHLRAERNPRLAADAKRIHGASCAVCGFNYEARYGALGRGYIEAHHLTPFSELEGRPTELDPKADFAVLCASFHRMVHRRQPPYDLDEVRTALT